MRRLIFCALVALSLTAMAADFRPYRRPVMTWVPPYGNASARANLVERDEPGATLTHLALQFWVPTHEGGLRFAAKYDRLSDELVGEWRDWCHAHGLRALLCVYNGEVKWDWGLAHDALVSHREEFTSALLAETTRLGLDGIDVDLEGNGPFEADHVAFIAFVSGLSAGLHAQGRQLFVDSFAYIWNVPNQRWWPELFPLVDGLTSMGYEETGEHSDGWRAYAAQTTAAGKDAVKLLVGIPTHLERWQEATVLEQVQWFVHHEGPGVALWDAKFRAEAWKKPELWELLRKASQPAP